MRAFFYFLRCRFLLDDVGESKGENGSDIVWRYIDHMTDFTGTEDDGVEVLCGLIEDGCE